MSLPQFNLSSQLLHPTPSGPIHKLHSAVNVVGKSHSNCESHCNGWNLLRQGWCFYQTFQSIDDLITGIWRNCKKNTPKSCTFQKRWHGYVLFWFIYAPEIERYNEPLNSRRQKDVKLTISCHFITEKYHSSSVSVKYTNIIIRHDTWNSKLSYILI